MPRNAAGWLGIRLQGIESVSARTFIATQERLQTAFNTKLPNVANRVTRRVLKKGIWRIGKLVWVKSTPDQSCLKHFNGWTKTKRTTEAEQERRMNCWEAVMYLAYQCDAISEMQCREFYKRGIQMDAQTNDNNLKSLFGVQSVYRPPNSIPNMGDIVACVNGRTGRVDHIALYAGNEMGEDYVLHNLSLDAATTGLMMGGFLHLEKMSALISRYQDNVTIYYTKPFWESQAPTHPYLLGLSV